MKGGTITLTEALRIIDSGQYIDSLKWVEADRKRGTGGKVAYEEGLQKMRLDELPDNILAFNKINPSEKRDPKHYDNSTRNLYITSSRRIKKVHIMLLLELDGKTILL